MSSHFEKNAQSWGNEGVQWHKTIPAIVTTYEAKWSIRVRPPFELNYNYVAPAEHTNGSQAVLKIGFPKDTEFQSEINALRVFNGEGICQLLEVDQRAAVMLIERITPGLPVAEVDNDDEATRIIASVMKKLHKPLPANHNFVSIKDLTAAIPEYKRKYQATGGPLPARLVDKAEALFEYLIKTSDKPVLTHGDLHHHNVLISDTRGWTAIDPKGIAAEPAYDVTAMMRNPYDKLKNVTNLKPLLINRLAILSEELGVDQQRLKDWCFAQMMLSAIWSVEGIKGPSHALRVAQALDSLTETYSQHQSFLIPK